MQSNKWGSNAWEFLHTITFNYPRDPTYYDKIRYRVFFENLREILPCSICRKSFCLFYDYIPIDDYLEDRHGVVYWLYSIHNIVNLKLNNELFPLKEVIIKYENNRARCGNIDTKDDKKLKQCQKPLIWNEDMELFLRNAIDKYRDITLKKVYKLIKENGDRQEIINIKNSLKKYLF